MSIQTLHTNYSHLPIGGGGYVTGFLFHPVDPQVMYCRTDIGGVYRFDYVSERWISLIPHVSQDDLRETSPISFALDPMRPGRLYIVSGIRDPQSHGLLTVSDDFGATFTKHELPFFVHGNLHGRGAGERLVVDPEDPSTLWMASQSDGLWFSRNEGSVWERVEGFPESACTFVARRGQLLLVGTEGRTQQQGNLRGQSLYASFDGGASFAPVEQPEYAPVAGSQLHGLVAQRCSFDDEAVYVSFSANGPQSQYVERGYSCDCGDCSSGRLARYALHADHLGTPVDITPEIGNWGYSAIDAQHGCLITATIHRADGDAVYLSQNQGSSWTKVLHRLEIGCMDFRLSYMQPRFNGGGNLIHWMTDVKFDPHRPGAVWFNTGTGVFRTQDVFASPALWQDWCDGMEETVHIGVYAPPAGRVQVLDMVGDLGGFAFTSVMEPCENSFANERGDRYITCLNCDWDDRNPDIIAVTARGNWAGRTQGGLILTRDGARTWEHLPLPFGLGEDLDVLLRRIAGVNTNAGWVALSSCGQTLVWALADRILLSARNLLVSQDGGRTYRRSQVFSLDGSPANGLMKPLSDRCDSNVFYGFGEAGQLYVSLDSGRTFREKRPPTGFPQANFGRVDCADRTEIRVASGQPGDIYVATGEGLWKLHYDRAAGVFSGRELTHPGDRVFCVGLGLGRKNGDYASERKAIYLCGTLGGEYGFYRTLDEGQTFQRLNTRQQMFGQLHSIDGDCRVYGRFYLATGSNGLLRGDVQEERTRATLWSPD